MCVGKGARTPMPQGGEGKPLGHDLHVMILPSG